MHRVEAKLAEWKSLYDKLGQAYRKLNAELASNASEADVARLREEIKRLEAASNSALQDVQNSLAASRPRPIDGSSGGASRTS